MAPRRRKDYLNSGTTLHLVCLVFSAAQGRVVECGVELEQSAVHHIGNFHTGLYACLAALALHVDSKLQTL